MVDLVESGAIIPGKALDLCCGAGTNPIYLAGIGFEVTALDISDKAAECARARAERASRKSVDMLLLVADFLAFPFVNEGFDFVFDFGCFHHVDVEDRNSFIRGVHRILKSEGTYLIVCFSHKNGPAWNHFMEEQIIELFQDHFEMKRTKHVFSIEGDDNRRYFYEVLMKKSARMEASSSRT